MRRSATISQSFRPTRFRVHSIITSRLSLTWLPSVLWPSSFHRHNTRTRLESPEWRASHSKPKAKSWSRPDGWRSMDARVPATSPKKTSRPWSKANGSKPCALKSTRSRPDRLSVITRERFSARWKAPANSLMTKNCGTQ